MVTTRGILRSCAALVLFLLVAGQLHAAFTNVFAPPASALNLRIPPSGSGGSGNLSQDTTQSQLSITNVAADRIITDLNVTLSIQHTCDSDLKLTLISPDGVLHPLANQRGGTGQDYTGTVFDDEAMSSIAQGQPPFTGTYRPEAPLTAVKGLSPNGQWTLNVEDAGFGDTGVLVTWSLSTTTEVDAPPQLAVGNTTIVEGKSGSSTARFSLTLSKPGRVPISCSYATADGTASAGSDYQVSSGTVTFAPGELIRSVPVTVVGDSTGEPDEFFFVRLTGVTGAQAPDTEAECIVVNDDPTGRYGLYTAPPAQSNLPIPTSGTGGSGDPSKDRTLSQLVVNDLSGDRLVADVNVRLSVEHTYVEDLVFRLRSPDGQHVLLATNRGGAGTNYTDTVFDDQAALSILEGVAPFQGAFRPDEFFSALLFAPAAGTWTLEIEDIAADDAGRLVGWSLELTSVVSSNAVVLAIEPGPEGVDVRWPVTATGYALESTTDPRTTPWSPVLIAPQLEGTQYRVSIPVTETVQLYRLKRP
jgi:subtilisin-like proprotein convertase family protein